MTEAYKWLLKQDIDFVENEVWKKNLKEVLEEYENLFDNKK